MSKSYPILFGYRDIILGRGFIAGVEAHGRALLTSEDDGEWWLYGVNPGGIAGGGLDRGDAATAHRNNYRAVLFDISSEAADFEAFKQGVKAYFYETNDSVGEEWATVHAKVREGLLDLKGYEKRKAEERPLKVRVVRLQQDALAPDKNALDRPDQLAA